MRPHYNLNLNTFVSEMGTTKNYARTRGINQDNIWQICLRVLQTHADDQFCNCFVIIPYESIYFMILTESKDGGLEKYFK